MAKITRETVPSLQEGEESPKPYPLQELQFTVNDFDANDTSSSLFVEESVAMSNFRPPPNRYESCTPISCNILHGDDPNDMPFVPFADDPTFDAKEHVLEYKSLSWQRGLRDPNLLTIVIEAARRLHYGHGIPLQDIDNAGILPFTLLTTLAPGAIWTASQSDPLNWPGSSQTLHPPLPDLPSTDRRDTQTRIRDLLTLFCPNPNCLQTLCLTHNSDVVALNLRNDHFRSNMFLFQTDFRDLRLITHISSPTPSCIIARICRKPCCEVFAMCQHLAEREFRQQPTLVLSDTEPTFTDNNPLNFTSNKPCMHSELTAREIVVVPRTVRDDGVDANTGREVCRNSQIQRERRKGVEVRHSNLGFGLFLTEGAREGDLIAEYEGELIYEETFETRGQVASHRGRSYVFGINPTFNNDSTYAGSPARFINHAPFRRANCEVNIYLVNGDHRIGVYAKKAFISAGSELLFDYGPEFFNDEESIKQTP
ncbi:Histone-lysine N-methyltransferase EZH1 [Grifola frondosa]|uniref:Histone-lysine N-methyltransferase EZH1 n=1 Tax=Grifola frondosa TaxID=5627 RepID=A0A1C7MLW2_GRIFR|nr:Histone-lysine N-methyltransferase EZH1 [Grifola frondosa]